MILVVRVVPNASKSEIVGWKNGALKIRIAAPAVEGKANQELIRFLSKVGGVSPSSISFISGLTSKQKRLDVPSSFVLLQQTNLGL